MIRFQAGDEELDLLLRFLRRRAPQHFLASAPLPTSANARLPRDRRLRRTPRPLLKQLAQSKEPVRWGLYTAVDSAFHIGNEESSIFVLDVGVAQATGQRQILLEARDELSGDPPDLSERARIARDLVERAARRVRRRGTFEDGHWVLPF